MKKIKTMSIIMMICLTILLSGCIVYGTGQTTGYIYAVDDGIFWNQVWYKSSLDSSESDCYLLNTGNSMIKQQLRELPSGTKVKLSYERHVFTLDDCPEGTGTSDVITEIEVVN